MNTDAWISLVVAALLLGYLVYVLLRPERF